MALGAEAVEEMLNDLAPNRLCEYLYELSGEGVLQGYCIWGCVTACDMWPPDLVLL